MPLRFFLKLPDVLRDTSAPILVPGPLAANNTSFLRKLRCRLRKAPEMRKKAKQSVKLVLSTNDFHEIYGGFQLHLGDVKEIKWR